MEIQFRVSRDYLRFVASFVRPLWQWGGLIVATTLMFSFLTGYFSYVLKFVVDALESSTRETVWDAMFWPGLNFVGCYVLMSLVLRLRMIAASYFYPKLQKNVTLEVHRILHGQVFGRFKDQMTGGILNRAVEFNRTLTSIFELLTVGLFAVTQVIVYMYFLSNSSIWFTMVYALWLAVFVPVTSWYSFRANHLARFYADSQSNLMGQMMDSINNIYFVKLFSQQSYESHRMEGVSHTTYGHAVDFRSYLIKLRWMMDGFILVIVVLNLWLLMQLYQKDLVSVGDFVFVLTSVVEMTWYISDFCGERLPLLVEEYGKGLQAFHVFQFCKNQKEHSGTQKAVIAKGEVLFDKLYYGYDSDQLLFDDFSLHIKPGERVGLVGYSGSGKTTLMHLLTGFYSLNDGSIKVDGQDINALQLASLRKHIAMIPQDTALFHRSLMENIRYGNLDATDEMVIEAAKQAHAHNFIMELPEGYHTMVGERGLRLSGGQRQRIAIARAFLKNAPILLLDEATSALDTATEMAIYHSLQELMKGRTVMVIAHRLSTIKAMDTIVVMEKGCIVEKGSHTELLALKGHYAAMWSHQADADMLS